jgi:Fe2+ or Zn2+ uptake regulation protein
MALYDALAASKHHPTAEELFRIVKPRTGTLSLATVYNTLEALCKAGLARRLPTANGSCRYDADASNHPHIRFRDSDKIADVPGELGDLLIDNLPKQALKAIEQELGVKIVGVNIQIIADHVDKSSDA